MPFPTQNPIPFNQQEVQRLVDGNRGCYGLFRQGVWVYVGRADNIRKRLLEHLTGNNACIVNERPTHFVTVVTNDELNEEKRLIVELQPRCNQKVG